MTETEALAEWMKIRAQALHERIEGYEERVLFEFRNPDGPSEEWLGSEQFPFSGFDDYVFARNLTRQFLSSITFKAFPPRAAFPLWPRPRSIKEIRQKKSTGLMTPAESEAYSMRARPLLQAFCRAVFGSDDLGLVYASLSVCPPELLASMKFKNRSIEENWELNLPWIQHRASEPRKKPPGRRSKAYSDGVDSKAHQSLRHEVNRPPGGWGNKENRGKLED